jgi:hypothetical protein
MNVAMAANYQRSVGMDEGREEVNRDRHAPFSHEDFFAPLPSYKKF